MLSGSLTGHEKLHEYFDEPQEIIKFLLEFKRLNNQKDHQAIEDQLRLHKRIRQAEIFDADEKILYYTGEFLVFHFLFLYFISALGHPRNWCHVSWTFVKIFLRIILR